MVRSRTVLVVDDSPEDRELYQRYLRRDPDHTYTFIEAASGQQGLALWQQHHPDVVLLDYRLPDLDGLDFLVQLQAFLAEPYLPIIMVTGQGSEAIAVKALKIGVQDYLVKEQITPEGLQWVVNHTIETVHLRTQVQRGIERERVVSQISRKVYQTLDLEEVLQTTVTEVRRYLKTDRVLIFRFQADGWGTVITESVGAGWLPLQSTSYYDPCLSSDDMKPLRQGQVTNHSDIYDGSVDPCYVSCLERLQVRASLVIPIQQNEQLWGLLIAHHCLAPRQWQPFEVDWLKDLTTQVGIALKQAELYQQAQTELQERRQVEAHLRETEERFRTSVETMLDCFAIYRAVRDDQGTIVDFQAEYVNDAACLSSEIAREQHLQQGLCELLPAHQSSGLFEEYCRVVETGQPLVKDSLVYKDLFGHQQLLKAFDIQVAKYGDGYVAAWRDITDRKRMEEALRASEAAYSRLFNAIDEGFAVIEVLFDDQGQPGDHRILQANPAFEKHSGLLNPVGKTASELVPDIEPFWHDLYAQVLQTGQAIRTEIHSAVFDRWFDVSVASIGDQEQRQVAVLFTDISEQKRAEEALRQSAVRLEFVLNSAQFGTWEVDLSRQPYVVAPRSPLHDQIYGYEARLPTWTFETFIAHVHPDDRGRVETTFQKTISSYGDWDIQCRIRRTDGQQGWVWITGSVYQDQTGSPIRLIGLIADITTRKQAEQNLQRAYLGLRQQANQLEQVNATLRDTLEELKATEEELREQYEREQVARTEAEQANRIKDEFLAILSHELRSPLNPILGWAKLLQTRHFDSTKTAAALATIERNAKLQTQLIDDLLDVARILRGKLNMAVTPVELGYVIAAAIDTVRAAAVAKNILLNSVLPRIGRVSGDATRLQQIVWNLLSNAIKFTLSGGRVDIWLESVNGQAQLTVRDTGKGIHPNFLPHLFESFRQEDASTTRQHGGLGLGLAIVRYLVEAHGGQIWAESPGEGQGSTFTLQLPLLDQEAEHLSALPLPSHKLDLSGMRILTVDDEPDTRELLTTLLAQYGAEVLPLASAAAAIDQLASFQPDILVSDVGMPGMDGYALIRQIRTLPPDQGGQVPAIALTAYAHQEDARFALACGFQRHVTKPLDPEMLVSTITELVIQVPKMRQRD